VRPFISYAREDRVVALKLREDLLRFGVRAWVDVVELRPGENWALMTSRALRKSSHVLALLSNHSVTKQGYVQKEVREALGILDEHPPDAIFLIPIRLEPCEPAYERMMTLQWVDLFAGYEDALLKIMQSLDADSTARVELPSVIDLKPGVTTSIDARSLRVFFETDELIVSISRDIAAKLGATVVTPQPSAIANHVNTLAILGVTSIEQLECDLERERKSLLRFAAKALKNSHGRMLSGTVSLHYLERLLLARASDTKLAASFLEATSRKHQDPDRFLSALREAYESTKTTA
jgi:TIR domain